jgi:hypothetical protein
MHKRANIGRVLVNPAVFFGDPEELARYPGLSFEQKRELLHRWAFDAYRIENEMSGAALKRQASRLDAVIDALIELEETAGLSPQGHRNGHESAIERGTRVA